MSTNTCQHCGGLGVVDYIHMPCPKCTTEETAKSPRDNVAREQASVNCERCHSTGVVDSGGLTPWGSEIAMPCPSCNQKWDKFAVTGYAWEKDSSLEKWFPMTAEELKKLRHIVDRQDRELSELRNPKKGVKSYCGECGGEHEPRGATRDCVRHWRMRALQAENGLAVVRHYGEEAVKGFVISSNEVPNPPIGTKSRFG